MSLRKQTYTKKTLNALSIYICFTRRVNYKHGDEEHLRLRLRKRLILLIIYPFIGNLSNRRFWSFSKLLELIFQHPTWFIYFPLLRVSTHLNN